MQSLASLWILNGQTKFIRRQPQFLERKNLIARRDSFFEPREQGMGTNNDNTLTTECYSDYHLFDSENTLVLLVQASD